MIPIFVSRMVFSAVVCTSLGSAIAADGWFPPAPRSVVEPPQRGIFGLPIPQQWTVQSRRGACEGGNCQKPVNCPNGRCAAPLRGTQRAEPNPLTGPAVVPRSCPGGVCSVPRSEENRGSQPTGMPLTENEGWTPRPAGQARPSERVEPANPFRPVTAPLRDAFGTGYDSRELDLRSNYFRSNEGERSPSGSRSRGRSMEVPVELPSGTARI